MSDMNLLLAGNAWSEPVRRYRRQNRLRRIVPAVFLIALAAGLAGLLWALT